MISEALDDGIHGDGMWKLLTTGQDPFLPGAYEQLRARKLEAEDRLKPGA